MKEEIIKVDCLILKRKKIIIWKDWFTWISYKIITRVQNWKYKKVQKIKEHEKLEKGKYLAEKNDKRSTKIN